MIWRDDLRPYTRCTQKPQSESQNPKVPTDTLLGVLLGPLVHSPNSAPNGWGVPEFTH